MTRFKWAGRRREKLSARFGVGLSAGSIAGSTVMPRSGFLLTGLAATLAICATASAAEPRAASGTLVTQAVGAGTALPSMGVGGMLQGLLGLAVVLAMVFGCAWFARRFGMQPKGPRGVVKIVGGVMLTQKERVVVVEVAGTWLVLGVAPGQVNTLHTVPAGSAEIDAANPGNGSAMFSNRLRDSLAKRFGGMPPKRRVDGSTSDAGAAAGSGSRPGPGPKPETR